MRSRSWLFEGFQQGTGCLIIHAVGIFDDKDACGAFEGPKVGFALQLAHHLHPDYVFERARHCYVSVLAPNYSLPVVLVAGEGRKRRSRDSLARRAFVAGLDPDAIATVESFGQLHREQLLSDALYAGEKQRARHAAPVW